MANIRHATVTGTNSAFVRGGVRNLYPVPTRVGGSHRRPPAARRTNRRDGPVSALASESLACVVMRFLGLVAPGCAFAAGNQRKQHVYSNKTANASRQTLGLPWPTQGVGSKIQLVAQKSDSLGLCKAAGASTRDANHDLAHSTL